MNIFHFFGLTLATNLALYKEVSINFLRSIPVNSAVEKIFLVETVENMFNELELLPFHHSSFEDRVRIMDGLTIFIEFILNSNDINERRINSISKVFENNRPLKSHRSFEDLDKFAFVIIDIAHAILITTGIDMFSHMPAGTIPNQDLIESVLSRIASSDISPANLFPKRLASLSRADLEHVESLSGYLVRDCNRMIASNPGRMMLCYPIYALIDMDVSTFNLSDLLMGPELETLEGMVSDFCPIENFHIWKRIQLYKLVNEKRKMNPRAVSEVLGSALNDVSTCEDVFLFYDGVISEIRDIEPLPSELAFEEVSESKEREHDESRTAEPAFEDANATQQIPRILLDSVLSIRRLDLSRFQNLAILLEEWIPQASGYEMLRLARYLFKNSNSREELFLKGLAEASNIVLVESEKISFFRTLDPRSQLMTPFTASTPSVSMKLTEEATSLLNRYRKISFGLRSILPYLETLRVALAVRSDELVAVITDQIESLISETPTIVHSVFTEDISAIFDEFVWGIHAEDNRIKLRIARPQELGIWDIVHDECSSLITRIPVMMKILPLSTAMLLPVQELRQKLHALLNQLLTTEKIIDLAHKPILFNICQKTFEWDPVTLEPSRPSLDEVLAWNQLLDTIFLSIA
jgi:hypothetical protein